ncbi:hypothetical protein ACQY0O_007450 [Thecaphora frezii]
MKPTTMSAALASSGCSAQRARPATLFEHLLAPLQPLFLLLLVQLIGFPLAIWHQLTHFRLSSWLNPLAWIRLTQANGFSFLLSLSDKNWAHVKAPLLASAHGAVLEIGAGTGENVRYYTKQSIERLVCLEPMEELRPRLERAVEKAGLAGKTTVVPRKFSVDALRGHGWQEGGFDCIVLVQVLCSLPDPKQQLKTVQKLLKPGGEVLVFEHVANQHWPAKALQRVWTPLWSRLMGGCNMDRPSTEWIEQLGGWKEVEVLRPEQEHSAHLLPHAVARFVKA